MTIAEKVTLKEVLVKNPLDPNPNTCHTLPQSRSKVYHQLDKIHQYSVKNDMKINFGKTKMMVFNPSTSLNFTPHFLIEGKQIEVISEFKLLGLFISNDMKWKSNTMHMVQKASKRLWILRRLKNLGAQSSSLIEVYTKQIRSILEFGVAVWQGSITLAEKNRHKESSKVCPTYYLRDGILIV